MKLILLDLDRTLFDSDRFYVDICQLLNEAKIIKPGVLATAVKLLHSAARSLYLTELIKTNQLNRTAVFDLARTRLRPNDYLHPDVAPFLKRFEHQRLVVLTTGEYEYQTLKLDLTPSLNSCVRHIISVIDKGVYIKARLEYGRGKIGAGQICPGEWFEQIYFIDDRPYNFNSLVDAKDVRLYHILRSGGKASTPFKGRGVSIILSLAEVN